MEGRHVFAIAGGIGCLIVLLLVALLLAVLVVPAVVVLTLVHAFVPADHPPYAVPPVLAAYYSQVADGYGVYWQHLAAWDGAQVQFQLPIPSEQQIYDGLYQAALDARRQDCAGIPLERRETEPLCNPPPLSPEEIASLHRQAHQEWVRSLLDHIEQHARALQEQGAMRDDGHQDRSVDWAALVGQGLEEKAGSLALGYTAEEALEDAPDVVQPSIEDDADFIPESTLGWPVQGPVLVYFGPRWTGSPPGWRLHPGVDLGAPAGTPVQASGAGRVVRAGPDPTYGNLVVIDHGGGYSTWYSGLSELQVAAGDEVTQGQMIALTGKGRLHFEVRYQDVPRNPLLFLS